MIDTKKATGRRSVHFDTLGDALGDLESLDGGALEAAGNWSPAENVDHVAKLVAMSLDGFPPQVKGPLPIRLVARLFRGAILKRPFKPGIKLPARFDGALDPEAGISWDEAVARFRALVERVEGGDRMTVPSPIFGALGHEDWVTLHCRHAELHFSFFHPRQERQAE
jgi:hypothetical protein